MHLIWTAMHDVYNQTPRPPIAAYPMLLALPATGLEISYLSPATSGSPKRRSIKLATYPLPTWGLQSGEESKWLHSLGRFGVATSKQTWHSNGRHLGRPGQSQGAHAGRPGCPGLREKPSLDSNFLSHQEVIWPMKCFVLHVQLRGFPSCHACGGTETPPPLHNDQQFFTNWTSPWMQ